MNEFGSADIHVNGRDDDGALEFEELVCYGV